MIYDVGRGGFTSLKNREDRLQTEYLVDPLEFPDIDLQDSKWFGHIVTKYRVDGHEWQQGNSAASADVRSVSYDGKLLQVSYTSDSAHANGITHFDLHMGYRLEEDGLYWEVSIANRSGGQIEFDCIGAPLLFNQIFRGDSKYKYEQNVLRHTFIAGEGSYVYWARSNGTGPCLVMLTRNKTGLQRVESESRRNVRSDPDKGSPFGGYSTFNESWEGLATAVFQGSSSLKLSPGDSVKYDFKLAWASSFADIGRLAYEEGQVDVEVLPGMAVPSDCRATILLRSKKAIHALSASYPDQTDIRYEGEKRGYQIYSVAFQRLGANDIKIHYGDGETCTLQFFSLEELEQLIDRHAAFIAENQFETAPDDPCYHGLLMWDMTVKSRINAACNPYGDDWWAGGSDEIGLVSGLFLSEKNVYRPNEAELKVLDAYLSDFIEDRLTEQPGYRVHRMVPWFVMFEPWAGHGADDVWRAFNYVHVLNTYFNLYRIQKKFRYSYLKPAAEYLSQAFHYTKAMFSYWMFPEGVGASEYGNMGELTIPLYLADALDAEGMNGEAKWVREIAAAKAGFFAKSNYPFGSEMAYDSTAYEAVYAYAKAAGDARTMEKAVLAAFSNRGHQPKWYYYNTDLRQHGETHWNVSYMTQLGGWVLYDYSLNEGKRDYELIKSAYASYLAGWTLINSGYWNDDPRNIGGSCWVLHAGWEDSSVDVPGRVPLIKQAWQMSGESGLGYFAGLKMAASVVIEHPVLGIYGLGCEVSVKGNVWIIRPRDGLRMRVHDTVNEWSIEIDRNVIRELEADLSSRTIRVSIENTGFDLSEDNINVRSERPWSVMINQ
ncbi:DUF5695 domain-containing protein [Cohnella lubricantis]|nr:DUF5695 domain-containing protein [Cohnella lubricantis]